MAVGRQLTGDEREEEAEIVTGCGALLRALAKIGGEPGSGGDRELAKIIVDNELPLRALVAYALRQVDGV